jgi:hypothetical protein
MALDDNSTVSLLHFDGADSGTTFTDESGKAWGAVNHVHTHQGEKKFGTASAYFDGADDGLYTADHAGFAFGAGDFTIDFWVYAAAAGQANASSLAAKCSSIASYCPWNIHLSPGSYVVKISMSSTGSSWNLANGAVIGTVTQNVWAHIAVVRTGGWVYGYMNGVLGCVFSVGTTSLYNAATTVLVGYGNYASSYLNGYIDELRFTKGLARWVAPFTVPTNAYARVAACYLHTRRDRLNRKGVSTQNSLA